MQQADLEVLHARLERPLYNVAFRWTWHADDASDLVQETFVRLWGMRRKVDLKTVEPLVYRILLNLAASRRRARRVWRWVSLAGLREAADEKRSPEERLAADARRAEVREAVEKLPDGLRSVVVLCECTDLTHDRVAEILGIPPGTVGSRRHRALRLLRERLESAEVRNGRVASETV